MKTNVLLVALGLAAFFFMQTASASLSIVNPKTGEVVTPAPPPPPHVDVSPSSKDDEATSNDENTSEDEDSMDTDDSDNSPDSEDDQ